MKFLRGILLPAVPIAIAVLGHTQGAASAAPKNPCTAITRSAGDNFHDAVVWERAADWHSPPGTTPMRQVTTKQRRST